jgi:uncharacterized protein
LHLNSALRNLHRARAKQNCSKTVKIRKIMESFTECYGIDFGAQMAGTTVVAEYSSGGITLHASRKGQNADTFLQKIFVSSPPIAPASTLVCIDAPLSLPSVYSAQQVASEVASETDSEADYFYRAADRALAAMSPMFLGGLTARAMRFAAVLKASNYAVLETYPAAQARRLGLKEHDYKGAKASIGAVVEILAKEFPCSLPDDIPTWHHVDALLCLCAALRYNEQQHEQYGDPSEGVIVV